MPRKKVHQDPNDPTIRIKKYGNRRLYSMKESRYITLSEVENLVKDGQPVKVIDASNDRDITSEILTQILLEGGKVKNFPAHILMEMVRMQDDALKTFYDRYLSLGLDYFYQAQKEWGRMVNAFTPFSQFNLADMNPFMKSRTKENSDGDLQAEIAQLKERLAAFESKNSASQPDSQI